jgi:hypothetical protein
MARNWYYIKASFEVDAEVYEETKSLLTACNLLDSRAYKIGTVVMDRNRCVVLKVRGGKAEAIAAQKYNDAVKKTEEKKEQEKNQWMPKQASSVESAEPSRTDRPTSCPKGGSSPSTTSVSDKTSTPYDEPLSPEP